MNKDNLAAGSYKRIGMRIFALGFLLSIFCLAASIAYASCSGPSGAPGDMMYNSGYHVPQYCNGTLWRSMGPNGVGGAGCAGGKLEGDIIYNSDYHAYQFCDGANFLAMGPKGIGGGGGCPTTSGLVGYWNLDEGAGATANDTSGNGNDGTLVNSPAWTSSGQISGALTFNGTNDITVPDASSLNPANALTVAAWVKTTTLTPANQCNGDTGTSYIVFKRNSNTACFEGYSLSQSSSGYYCFVGQDGTGCGGLNFYACGGTATVGAWTHVVGVFSKPNALLYVNGVQVGSASYNASLNYAARPLFVGRSGECGGPGEANYDGYFSGAIDDVRIYNRALSAAEVTQLYNAGPIGDEGSIVYNNNSGMMQYCNGANWQSFGAR